MESRMDALSGTGGPKHSFAPGARVNPARMRMQQTYKILQSFVNKHSYCYLLCIHIFGYVDVHKLSSQTQSTRNP